MKGFICFFLILSSCTHQVVKPSYEYKIAKAKRKAHAKLIMWDNLSDKDRKKLAQLINSL